MLVIGRMVFTLEMERLKLFTGDSTRVTLKPRNHKTPLEQTVISLNGKFAEVCAHGCKNTPLTLSTATHEHEGRNN